ncbi:hypothetical protein GCM10010468_61090 [Actinocorallia longicatena]|uniref:DUF4350 domain-containing protein n=1 Tax=Actinocorallia longicatena TaxID=111803 RepID=A0ABP6QH79_9ACTN
MVALGVVLLSAGPAAAEDPPHAGLRLDRVARALAHDPLFVDDDLADVVTGPDRDRIRAAMKTAAADLGVPVYVALLPNPRASESQGRGELFLQGVHDRSHADGLYLTADEDAGISGVAYGVPRDLDYDVLHGDQTGPADDRAPFADLTTRIEGTLALASDSPAGPPETPRSYSGASPFGQEDSPPREPEFWAPFLIGALLAGPFGALGLWVIFLLARAVRRRPAAPPRPPRSPGVRELRALAARELEALGDLLPPADDAPGRRAAMEAYDAAVLLSDEVGARPGRHDDEAALDLIGVVVLAVQGRTVLSEGRTAPRPACQVNPLHGAGTRGKQIPGVPKGKVCADCAALPLRQLRQRVLTLPGGRPYHVVPGRFRDGFGGSALAKRVLESLGVD